MQRKAERIELAKLPTPLERMTRLEQELDRANLYIKRDDLTDVGLSGNKIRKLEFILAQAVKEGCDTVLTYGGPQTNHGRLTAAAARRLGLDCILILDGEKPEHMSGNLLLDMLMGADLRFVGDGSSRELAREVIAEYTDQNAKVYEIPMGGSDAEGALGYFYMAAELVDQLAPLDNPPRHVVVGAGSMGTAVGLILGAKYFDAPFDIIPIAITPTPFLSAADAAEYGKSVSEKYDLGITLTPEDIDVRTGRGEISYTGPGYNVPDPQTRRAIRLLAGTEAIFTDPCYTGKVFNAFVDLALNVYPEEEGMVFVHTGGVPGLFTAEHLAAFEEDLW